VSGYVPWPCPWTRAAERWQLAAADDDPAYADAGAPLGFDDPARCAAECIGHLDDGRPWRRWDCRLPEGHDGDHVDGDYRWPTGGPLYTIHPGEEAR
jgi:hypothetical protein